MTLASAILLTFAWQPLPGAVGYFVTCSDHPTMSLAEPLIFHSIAPTTVLQVEVADTYWPVFYCVVQGQNDAGVMSSESNRIIVLVSSLNLGLRFRCGPDSPYW